MSARLKVLFVCAMNKQRSVTAERLYRNDARLDQENRSPCSPPAGLTPKKGP
jgi:protein-tyrosine-phosphatase